MPIVVRSASADEVVDLRWRVLRPRKPREAAIWDGDADARHWVAVQDDRIVGIASAMRAPYPKPEELAGKAPPQWQLRGMAVEPGLQGSGVGKAVLGEVVRDVGEPMWCNARVTALPFYLRQGWRATSDTFDTNVGPHRRMVSGA